ncbi:hypothetical protein [Bacillus sp. EB01]|uniref:hypothetical protein n=1 Tax=Bacillus sp. EB01 TaxID=1347086 RepID=UPI000694DA45|nr:hypothetical protein [Bacillus sp. EB01]
MRKVLSILLVLQLFLTPLVVSAEQERDGEDPQQTLLSKEASVQEPKQSKGETLNYTDPANYPLKQPGDLVDFLYDSYGYQYFYYDNLTDYSTDEMKLRLIYYSQQSTLKDTYFWLEFFKEDSGSLVYQDSNVFDTYGYSAVGLASYLSKEQFADQPFIYIRVGITPTYYSSYYTDTTTFKIANPFYTGNGNQPLDSYVLISNESTDSASSQPTGVFSSEQIEEPLNKSVNQGIYKRDFNKAYNPKLTKSSLVNKSTNSYFPSYQVGDNKYFWVSNLATNQDYQVNARLAYSGTKANIWVNDNQISDSDTARLGEEFDSNIYPSVTNNFGKESDVNQDGKINILCYDIQDGFNGSGGYVGGYFWGGDLYTSYYSNQSEIFYIDTYPAMGLYSKDVAEVYETIAHEFQHMVNYNQNVLLERGATMDTWLNEAFSMAAEQIYSGNALSSRINYYNNSASIQNGHSLLYWDRTGNTLSNYALSYLFGQYFKLQAGQGNRIFKEIMNDTRNNHLAVEAAAKKYIDTNLTFGKLMTHFRAALLLKESSGLHGFKGDPSFDSIETKPFAGSSQNLRGGGAVVVPYNSTVGFKEPAEKRVIHYLYVF